MDIRKKEIKNIYKAVNGNTNTGRKIKEKPLKLIKLVYDEYYSEHKKQWHVFMKKLRVNHKIIICKESLMQIVDCIEDNKVELFRPLNENHYGTKWEDFASIMNEVF